ncbi:MAG: hypothetical protein ABI870_06630 [Rhodanobacter sp.]
MPSSRTGFMLGCALLMACIGRASGTMTNAQWQVRQAEALRKSDAIMDDANRQRGLLARYRVMRRAYDENRDPVFHLIFDQYLSWYQSYLGDYPAAAASFSMSQPRLPDDHTSPLSDPAYSARSALQAIPELAKNYRAVLFNEAHNVAQTRTLTVQLLGKLRQQGFNYFAAETLYAADDKLQQRGYPIRDSGFYTEEPICAEMVRTALKLGYKIIAYEAGPQAQGDAREAEQARNIYNKVFRDDPHARLVVDAGYAHIQESGPFLGGASMAEHLHKLSGIDALTVEQTVMYAHQSGGDDHPYYSEVIRKLRPAQPIVFETRAGRPWTLRVGYDVSVFFPPPELRRGRPTWLELGGLRKPYTVNSDRCQRRYPCLVEARHADEGADAIPADRLVLDPSSNAMVGGLPMFDATRAVTGELYLRPGRYIVTYQNENGHPRGDTSITVTAK